MYITSTPAEITTIFFLHTNVTIAISIKAPATKNNNSPPQLLSCAITPIKTQIVPMTANEIDTFFTMLPPLIFSHRYYPKCRFIPPYICLIHGIFLGGCHPPNFPFFKIYEAFAPFSVSFFCFGFNHSSSEKLQSLISPDHLSGCFSFAFAYTSFRFSNISRSSPLCLCSGVT